MICRTLAEVIAAADADHDGPLTQDQADLVAAILAPHAPYMRVACAASPAQATTATTPTSTGV